MGRDSYAVGGYQTPEVLVYRDSTPSLEGEWGGGRGGPLNPDGVSAVGFD